MPTPRTSTTIKKLPTGIELLPSGMYRTRLRFKGANKSASHPTLADAKLWIEREKFATRQLAAQGLSAKVTLAQAVERYTREVCPLHRGEKWELARFGLMLRYLPNKLLTEFAAPDFVKYRDQRLKMVSPASVRREMGLLGALFEVSRREWRYIAANPCLDVSRPIAAQHRERLVSDAEVQAMCDALGYTGKVTTFNHEVAIAMLLALETGMRSGEIVGLTWDRVHLKKQYVRLDLTKNGTSRDVPLSKAAVSLFELMRGVCEPQVFHLTDATRDALFRKARKAAGLAGFTYHDLRHTAATRLAGKIHALELCKVFGWKDPKKALLYFNPTATDIAGRLG
jgi:integrase